MRKKLEKLAVMTAGTAFFALVARDIATPAAILSAMAALRQLAFIDLGMVNRGRTAS
jgi:hypothetical protein